MPKISTSTLRAYTSVVATLLLTAATATILLIPFWRYALSALLIIELLFPFYFLFHYRRLNAQPVPHEPLGVDHRKVFDRFVKEQQQLARYLCIKDMLENWFWKTPFDQIKRGNIAELVSYGFFYKSVSEMPAGLLDQLLDDLEEAWGITVQDGYNPDIEFMAHLWQPVRCHYRPFSWYACVEFLFLVKHIVLLSAGFTAHHLRCHTYYTKGIAPRGTTRGGVASQGSGLTTHLKGCDTCESGCEKCENEKDTPVLFLHGVGIGLLPYIPFVMKLVATGRPVIALECAHLGMRLRLKVPSVDDVVSVIINALDIHGIDKVCVSGHSYGTFKASRLVQLHPERVHSLAIIDPVCLIMFNGKLIHNFVYDPAKSSAFATWIVARDVHHASSVCRNFYWTLLCLWADQLPARTLVVLSGDDELVPVEEAIVMLQHESDADLLYMEGHRHADFLKYLPWQDRIVSRMENLFSKDYQRPAVSGLPPPYDLRSGEGGALGTARGAFGPMGALDKKVGALGALDKDVKHAFARLNADEGGDKVLPSHANGNSYQLRPRKQKIAVTAAAAVSLGA